MLLSGQEPKYAIHHDMERSESLVLEKLRRIISGPFLTASRSSLLFLLSAAAQQLAVLTSTLCRVCLSQAVSTDSCWKVLAEVAESLVTPHPPRILNHGCLQKRSAKFVVEFNTGWKHYYHPWSWERNHICSTFLEQDSSLWTRASSCIDSKETISYAARLCGDIWTSHHLPFLLFLHSEQSCAPQDFP